MTTASTCASGAREPSRPSQASARTGSGATAAAGGARGASAARTTAQARAPGQQAVARCVRSARRGGRGAIPARRRRTPPAAILAIDASERLRASARSVCTGATAMAARGAALGARARRRRPQARAPGLTDREPSAPHARRAIGLVTWVHPLRMIRGGEPSHLSTLQPSPLAHRHLSPRPSPLIPSPNATYPIATSPLTHRHRSPRPSPPLRSRSPH